MNLKNVKQLSDGSLAQKLPHWLALITLSLGASLSHALPDDKYKAVHIKADSAERDERKGVTEYRGNVEIDQGSLHISAQRITIYGKREITRIVATGTPAKLHQLQDVDGTLLKAQGNSIDYSPAKQHVQIQQNAWIEQDGSTVSGTKIDYYIDTQIVRAGGDPKEQVHVVIPAATKPESSEEQ